MYCVNRTESLARDRIFGKTWQDFSGVALRENSCKKNLVENEQPQEQCLLHQNHAAVHPVVPGRIPWDVQGVPSMHNSSTVSTGLGFWHP